MKNTPISRLRRALLLGLVLLITIPALLYTWEAGVNARAIRSRDALTQNRSIAQIGAQIIDEQYNSEIGVLRRLALGTGLDSKAESENRSKAERLLRETVAALRNLVFAAAYSHSGRLIAAYPPASAAPQDASKADWFDALSSAARTSQIQATRIPAGSSHDMIALALPLGKGSFSRGYLLVSCSDAFSNWLERSSVGGTAIYIVDFAGDVVVSTDGNPGASGERFRDYKPHLLAQRRAIGAIRTPDPGGKEEALVGYAYARRSMLSVLVVQPTASALAATNRLMLLTWLPPLFLFFVVVGASWKLEDLYRRQEEIGDELQSQNSHLLSASRAKSDVLANVSHELRTPLATMQVSISGIVDTDVNWAPEQVRDVLRSALEDIEHLEIHVRNLLEMSRIEGSSLIKKQPYDLTDIAGAALEQLKPRFGEREVSVDFPSQALMVECDVRQIETVIANLLENALKYSPPGSPLYLSGENRGDYTLFTLRDEGPGVARGTEQFLFDKFYRAPPEADKGGTGLGLAICKGIIKAHHGEIDVRNYRTGGAEFWFTLPTLGRRRKSQDRHGARPVWQEAES